MGFCSHFSSLANAPSASKSFYMQRVFSSCKIKNTFISFDDEIDVAVAFIKIFSFDADVGKCFHYSHATLVKDPDVLAFFKWYASAMRQLAEEAFVEVKAS